MKKATEQSDDGYTTGYYEVYGHGGVGLIVATLTDNSNRANMAIKSFARKSDVKMASSGSVMFNFDHKAVFTASSPFDKDAVMEQAIEKDIEDLDFHANEEALAMTEADQAHQVQDYIVSNVDQLTILQEITESLSILGSSQLMYLPKERVKVVTDEDFHRNIQLIEGFEQLDDVDVVFHNMDMR